MRISDWSSDVCSSDLTTASGLQYEVLTEGKGSHPKATDTVTVNYKGSLINGEEFDSSYSRGQPVSFPLNNVIPGWTEGVQLMTPGSKYKVYIPSELGYGERGAGVQNGPNQELGRASCRERVGKYV